MKVVLFIIGLILLSSVTAADPFADEDYEAGLLELEPGDEMFYWLLRSRNNPTEDPLVLWLTGGPGCSSELALFYENGPWSINDDLTLKRNDYSWNEISNLLYVDQPLGTGFSKTDKPDHYAKNEDMVAETFYKFLTMFIEKFPEYKGRDFYITGESYAGHYIPAITAYIIEQKNPDIKLIRSAIGNGLVKPITQYPAYNTFAHEEHLIGALHSYALSAGYWVCQKLIQTGLKFIAFAECQIMTTTILGNPPAFNVYDIRKKCDVLPLCYDMSNIDRFIELPEVREALGVGDRSWSQCDNEVHTKLLGDWITDLAPKVRYALENDVGYLVYSGDKDFTCNWRGGEAWANEIFWSKQRLFQSAEYEKWTVAGEDAGEFKQVDNLTFLRVYEAGHMVPMDQPENALEMLKKFIAKEF